jgi:glyoxylase-like metal-dependent hydrolase (beta-lactamase superfamily II)
MKQILTIAAMHFVLISVAFSQPRNVYEIYALEYVKGSSRTPASVIAPGADSKDSVDFSYFIWYLKGDNGRKVLVDAGMVEDENKLPSNLRNYIRPDLMLRRINVNINDITDIIITHPHSDHINGLELFPRGTIWMQKKDFAYFVGDAWQKGANHLGLDKQDVKYIIQANLDGRLQLVDGDSIEIIPGIRVFIGSKHTFESQHLLVDSNAGKVL